ncbi:MAG: hypothetical protein GC186_14175 [Rhodobacteraceae bacterium]|nr:hypothetical protein [Paracoccaceae bacterium]
MRDALAAFVIASAIATVCAAQTGAKRPSDRYLGARGIVFESCGEFLRYSDVITFRQAFVSWVYGYWTGMNFGIGAGTGPTGPNISRNIWDKSVEPDALVTRVKAKCIENSSASVFDAISDIYWKLPQMEK